MKNYIIVIIILLFVFHLYSAPQKEKIVVLNFKSINIDKGIADVVTKNIMTSIVDFNVFQVIERAQIDKIFDELKLTSKDDFDDKIAMQVGKIAKAKIVLVGSVTKLGNKITLDARGIEVETGNVSFGKSISANNENDLSDTIQQLAAMICDVKDYNSKNNKNLIKRTIAILPFYNQNNVSEYEYLTDTLRDGLRAKLQATDSFNFISFPDINDVIKKLNYKKNDLIDEQKAIKIALNVKADVVITGKYTVVKDKVMITTNALDVLGDRSVISSTVNGGTGVEVFLI